MFGKGITLFKLFGFEVRVDLSWVVLAVLITWTLARGLFPGDITGLATSTYWIMGAFGAIGIFFSIVVHEFSHSVVARRFGLPIRSITLFIFGGVAQMEEEPPSPRAEFFMAVAGPLVSIGLGFFFWLVLLLGRYQNWPVAVTGVFRYLRTINFILAGFNLLPAFPLDGGRILRAALWKGRNNIRRATRIASRIGGGFGIALIVLGFISIIRGAFIGGMWWILIGFFMRGASRMSYQRLLMTETLKGEPVSRFMNTDVVTVPPQASIEELVEDYVYRYHYKLFPVATDGTLEGCITTRQIKEIPREEWSRHTVRELAEKCDASNTVASSDDATAALAKMHQNSHSRLMVVDEGRLVGIISLKDLLHFLSLKLDLEGGERTKFGDRFEDKDREE
jgi:Zn-dependent protease/predicted transcriptional regulator